MLCGCPAIIRLGGNEARGKWLDPRQPIEQASVERDLGVIRSTLTDAELTTLTAEGQALTLADALSLALEEAQR